MEATTVTMACELCGPPHCPVCGVTRQRFHHTAFAGCYSSHSCPPPDAQARSCKYCGSDRVRWNGWGYVCGACGRKQ